MPDDLTIVAQYAKSNRDTPSDVYNAACRVIEQPNMPGLVRELLKAQGKLLDRWAEADEAVRRELWRNLHGVADQLRDALNGAESNGDARTPQTLGTAGREGAREAQGAAEPLVDPDCRDGKHGSCVGGPCECTCHQGTTP